MKVLTLVLLGVVVGRGVSAHGQAPSPAGAGIEAGQAAALSWLNLVDRGQYSQSWDSAATFYRNSVTKSAAADAIRKARSSFEPFGGRKLLSASYQTTLPNAPPGEYVVLQYEVHAGSGRLLVETVTPMKDLDNRWRVSGYYIRPK